MIKKLFYILLIISILFFGFLELGNLLNGIPKDKAIAVGYFSAFFYTFIFGFILRNFLQKKISNLSNKVIVFTIIGTIGSIFIEGVIWLAQTVLNTTGAAIHTNIFIDLIMTVPFYALLSYLFAKWVLKYSFTWPVIAIMGGVYEAAADGILGNLVQFNLPGALISPILIPLFIIPYSTIILVPFLLTKPTTQKTNLQKRDYLILLKPLWALLIFPLSLSLGFIISKI